MTREASNDKRKLRQVHRQRQEFLLKRAGRRPALQMTREASADKRALSQVHKHRLPELNRAVQSCPELPGAAQSCPELPRANQS